LNAIYQPTPTPFFKITKFMKFLKQLKGIINKTEWKIYFFIFILGHIIAYDIVGAFNLNSIKSVISFIVLILSAIGFFGIAWRKKIFTQYFWKIFFILGIFWKISIFGSAIIFSESNTFSWSEAGSLFFSLFTLSIILAILSFAAIYYYTFKSPEIWKIEKKAETS